MAHEPFSAAAGHTPDPERTVTPEDFGRELTLARERAGLTIRQVAGKAGIPVSTAGDYFAGRHLPAVSQAETLRKIVRACGVSGSEQVDAWVRALSRARRAPGRRPAGAPAPYRGLASFEAEDAEWFFGRDDLIELLAGVVAAGPRGIPVTVTGASGSGKSSLLRAGLIPRLAAMTVGQQAVVMTPGLAPMVALASALGDAQERPPGDAERTGGEPEASKDADRGVVVVDQLEEVFTACQDEAERRDFIAALSGLADRAVVVLGLRADFYGHALRYPELAESLQRRQVVVGPMTSAQLREAIMGPARKAKLTLDPGLADLLISDLAPQAGHDQAAAGHEAGALPLLSHALRATWERRSGGRLTVAGYQEAGGIQNAIACTAEAAYAALPPAERELARRLFLRLVHVTSEVPLARARVPLDELPAWTADRGEAGEDRADDISGARVLARFVAERLVTLDEHTAQITHEALLTAWPRLRGWISADAEGLKIRHRIASAAAAWQEAGRDEAVLLRGGPLAIAADWAGHAANRDSLSPLAREFIDSASAHQQARRAADRHQVTRLRRLTSALTVLALLSGGLAGYALWQRHDVADARDQADSREVAVEAEQVRGEDPSLAAQLSLAAYQIDPSSGALASLLESAAYPAAARFRDSAAAVQSVALAPDHRTLAVASADGTLRLWSLASPTHPARLGDPLLRLRDSPLYAEAYSPDGKILAAAGAGKVIRLFNVANPRHPVPLGRPLTGPRWTVYSLAFSPDGRILAAGSADKTIRLWNMASPARPVPLARPLAGHVGYVQAVAFSPDGKILAAAGTLKTVRLWSIADPAHPVPLDHPLTGPAATIAAAAFSPDGNTLAAGSYDNSVWLWDITSAARRVRARTPLTSATDWVNAVAFSPDGRMLAAASSDDTVRLWGTATGALLGTLPGPQPVTSLAWDGDRTLIAGGTDGMVRAWTVPPPILLDANPVNQVSFSPDGRLLAVATADGLRLWNPATRTQVASATVPGAWPNSVAWAAGGRLLAAGYSDGTVRLWRASQSGFIALGRPLPATGSGIVEFVAFRQDGRVLASTADDGTVRLWDVANPANPVLLAVLRDSGTYVFSAAFSPDGKILAAASSEGLTRLWDVANPARPRPIGKPLAGPTNSAYSVAFSPSGRVLAVGSADKTVRLWDVTVPARPRRLGASLTGPGGFVYSVAFSPSGRVLAAGVTDGTIWLWNITDPAAPVLITHVTSALSPTGHIYSVAFSPAGTTLASGSSDGSARLWDIQPAAAADLLCATAGQPLTKAEWDAYIPGRAYQPPCRS